LGSTVELTTSLGDVVTGVVSIVVPENGLVVLEVLGKKGEIEDQVFLSLSSLKSIKVLKEAETGGGEERNRKLQALKKKIGDNEQESITEKEVAAIKKRQTDLEMIGKGVSKEGQLVFDNLQKTLKCSWNGDVIVILGSVRVKNPYRVKDVEGGDKSSREYVCKTLEGIRKKFKLKD